MFLQYVPVPYIVAANGLGASRLAPHTVRAELNLPDDIDLIPCIATDRTSAVEVVLMAFKKVEATIHR